jgi:hypothetical protein
MINNWKLLTYLIDPIVLHKWWKYTLFYFILFYYL